MASIFARDLCSCKREPLAETPAWLPNRL